MKVYYSGNLIGTFKSDADLKSYMEKDGFSPDTVTISDHGNIHHYHLDGINYLNRHCKDCRTNCLFELDNADDLSECYIIQD